MAHEKTAANSATETAAKFGDEGQTMPQPAEIRQCSARLDRLARLERWQHELVEKLWRANVTLNLGLPDPTFRTLEAEVRAFCTAVDLLRSKTTVTEREAA